MAVAMPMVGCGTNRLEEVSIFCYQCEQTAKGTGCTIQGVCGKSPEVAALQDLLLYLLMGLSQVAVQGRKLDINDDQANVFTAKAAFATVTNVDFDEARFAALINRVVEARDRLKARVKNAGGDVDTLGQPAQFVPGKTPADLIQQGERVGLKSYPGSDPDILSLKHTVLFGIKGVCAYADHAQILGQEDNSVYAFVHEDLAAIQSEDLNLGQWIDMTLRCGEAALKAMELLDKGNAGTYGQPVPTPVPLGHKKGKAILISSHDLQDLEALLKQTQDTGINVYTRGEMLPTHGYPKLMQYAHFYGH